jgi:radical SAM superfamily enzyme YgiQ (UPF0313 family)
MKAKISWVQPNFQQGPAEYNIYYLPYSAGTIWAYCQEDPEIRKNFALDQMVWRREPIADTAHRLAQSDIVAFSTYVWNRAYNYSLAEEIKKIRPLCFLIFGGPEPAISDPDLFLVNNFMDVVVKLEGEITFKKILQSWSSRDFREIPGLLINQSGKVFDTGKPTRITDLENMPSPYLTGVFDQIMADNPTIEWNATLETNRGCPFACTFCDWGSLTYNKIKQFNLERVVQELEWMGQHRCGFVSIADANFGAFIERDGIIVDKIIEVQNRYKYPKSFSVAWAKNQKKEVVGLAKKLIDSPFRNQGLTLSVQSLDQDVLKNIKRRNMETNNLESIFAACLDQRIPVFTELILGLPGETLASWKENFWRLYRLGNHTGITVNHAQLLENSEMNLSQRQIYGIKSIKNYDYFPGVKGQVYTPECVEIVTHTRQLPTDDLLTAMRFSWFQNTWHISGLSTLIARFLNRYLQIDYGAFYHQFSVFLDDDDWWQAQQREISQYQRNWLHDGFINHPGFMGIQISGWNLIHVTVMQIQIDSLHDHVLNLVFRFIERFNLDPDLLNDLITLQQNYFIRHSDLAMYPKQVELSHNLWSYIQGNQLLEKRTTPHVFDFNDDKNMSRARFLENYYYLRRRNFGKATIQT